MSRVGIALIVMTALAVWLLYELSWGLFGEHEGPGTVTERRIPAALRAQRDAVQGSGSQALGAPPERQILFGDLHVHTTFSTDAFTSSLPLMQGEGAHPPADACDYARFCSALDFWSINDHAENLSTRHWRETVEAMRQCDAVADPRAPDVVPFLGWEWTQVGQTRETHYGHKNVVLRYLDEARIPARPIAAGTALQIGSGSWLSPGPAALALLERGGSWQRYLNFARYMADRAAVPSCPEGVDTNDLPDDCRELALTPQVLFRKLDEWGGESLVIPHGTTWGYYSPLGSSWDKQIRSEHDDPERQSLWELYSGHGNTEEHRDWRAIRFDEDGRPVCPRPTDDYLPHQLKLIR